MLEQGVFKEPFFSVKRNKSRARREARQARVEAARTRNNGPQDQGRRDLLFLGAGLGLLAAVGGGYLLSGERGSESPYDGWENYRDKFLPEDKMLAISKDLSQDHRFPGFSDVGFVVRMGQREPYKIKEFFPSHDGSKVGLRLVNGLTAATGALAALYAQTREDSPVNIRIRNFRDSKVLDANFIQPSFMDMNVLMEGSAYAAPDAVKRLLIVKEYSHFLYFRTHIDRVASEFLSNYEFEGSQPDNLAWFIYFNATNFSVARKSGQVTLPRYGDLFDNTLDDLDGAGFFHTTPAFGKMRDLGFLAPEQVDILRPNNSIYERSLASGILKKDGANYRFADGVGPFSSEWTSMARPIVASVKHTRTFSA